MTLLLTLARPPHLQNEQKIRSVSARRGKEKEGRDELDTLRELSQARSIDLDEINSLGILRARSEGVEERSVGSRRVGVGRVLAENRSHSSFANQTGRTRKSAFLLE